MPRIQTWEHDEDRSRGWAPVLRRIADLYELNLQRITQGRLPAAQAAIETPMVDFLRDGEAKLGILSSSQEWRAGRFHDIPVNFLEFVSRN